LLIAIPVGLYLWLGSDEDEAAPTVEQTVPPPAPPPAPQLEVQPAAPATVPPSTVPAPAQPPQAKPVQPSQTSSTAAVNPAAAASAAQPAPAKAASLRLQFDQAAWVQIRDNSGRMVHSGLNPAGSSVEVNGKAPFYLVVGNAEHVRVHYKGQAVDLKPFTAVNVARLTLNQ